jgi:hypothetical protein
VREREEKRDAADDDRAIQAVVLRQALTLHPAQLTVEELVLEIAADPADFATRDAIVRAVRDLARSGLLHRNGDFVVPTRAALRFDELLE